jgi:hypothetical protein
MKKLTQEEILKLEPTDKKYHVKLTRLFWPKPHLFFDGLAALFISRSPKYKKLPERLSTITTKDINWAESDWRDILENGDIVTEDYQMEIFNIEEDK